MSSKAH